MLMMFLKNSSALDMATGNFPFIIRQSKIIAEKWFDIMGESSELLFRLPLERPKDKLSR